MTAHLSELLQALDQHRVTNPDDDGDLTGDAFLDATDPKTVTLVKEIRDGVSETLIDAEGKADREAIAALRRSGDQVNEGGDPHDPNVAAIVIESEHGRLTRSLSGSRAGPR